jgi:hypothetical protein
VYRYVKGGHGAPLPLRTVRCPHRARAIAVELPLSREWCAEPPSSEPFALSDDTAVGAAVAEGQILRVARDLAYRLAD